MPLSKAIEDTTPRVNPNANYGLWVIMVCQCRLISCNKRAALVRDIDKGESCTCVRTAVYEKSLYLPLKFAMNVKLL